MKIPEIDEDIRVASTLPGALYADPEFFARVRERVFARAWHLVDDAPIERERVRPRVISAGCLDEPIVLTRDASGEARCLSNVCTHRANVVALRDGEASALRCGYHGRRFGLDGRCTSMPEFEQVVGFPGSRDDLRRLPLNAWGPLRFTSIDPSVDFDAWIAPLVHRLEFLEGGPWTAEPSLARDYEVRASWALYVDNYLEGFHIPFVHRGLAEVVDYGSYRTELFEHATLQIGLAKDGDDAFDAREGASERVAAYWLWLFPSLMLNFYPWGLSTNVVTPLAPDRTRVSYLAWVRDPSRLGRGAGGDLDRVEREDEEIVEQVQRGARSRLYGAGRYSPTRETGVHHFHRLLTRHAR